MSSIHQMQARQPLTTRRWQFFRWFVAALLLISALMKFDAWQFGVDSSAFFYSRQSPLALATVELLFAVYLVRNFDPRIAWAGAFTFFSIAFVVASRLALEGHSHCPCFGRVEASPWTAAGLDAEMIIGLISCRPFLGWKEPFSDFFLSCQV